MAIKKYEAIHTKTRKEWRKWLEKNHHISTGVWFTYYTKKSGKPRVSYENAVEEALCFGWIDSLPGKLDDERSMLKFTPRKPKSVWSQVNKARVEKLINDKLMMPAGIACIEIAKKNGSWEALTASDTAAVTNQLPEDLKKNLAKSKIATQNFQQFSFSIRKQFLAWIDNAKRPETRIQRIKQTILMAKANKKPGVKGFKI